MRHKPGTLGKKTSEKHPPHTHRTERTSAGTCWWPSCRPETGANPPGQGPEREGLSPSDADRAPGPACGAHLCLR